MIYLTDVLSFTDQILFHIRKPFHCFSEILDGLVRITVFDPVSDTMLYVSFQYHLSCLVQCRFCCVYLRQYVFTGYIFIHHTVYGLYLTYDLLQSAMQIIRIHTLSHTDTSVYPVGYTVIIRSISDIVKNAIRCDAVRLLAHSLFFAASSASSLNLPVI